MLAPGAGGRLGDICEVIAHFLSAYLGRNPFVNTNFSRVNVQIRKSTPQPYLSFVSSVGTSAAAAPGAAVHLAEA